MVRMARGTRIVRRVVRRRRGARRPSGKAKPLAGFTRVQSAAIKRAIGRTEESKYISTQLAYNQKIDPAVHTPGTDIVPLVPKISPGVGDNQRVGKRVTPTRCRVDLSVGFAQTNPGAAVGTASMDWAQQIYVVVFLLRSKPYKNWQQYAASQSFAHLLDNGDGTSTTFGYQVTPGGGGATFWTADTRDMMKPIEGSEYTLLKKRVIKLTKNYGSVDSGLAGTGQVPNMNSTSYRGSFTYALPELKFDDDDSNMGGYPTNTNLMLALGWCYADNLGTYGIDGSGTPFPPDQYICYTARQHVWYKDG